MRVVLASAPHRDTFGYSMPPPGLLRLGGELLRRGVDVALEDLSYRLAAGDLSTDGAQFDRAAELLLADGPPHVLGLSTMGATLPAALLIADAVRRRAPEVRILVGGPGTQGTDVGLLERFGAIDAVVRGEGEVTLPAVLERWSRGESLAGVAGVTHRDGAGRIVREPERPPLADLDRLPDPAWELLPPLDAYKRITGAEDGLVPIDSGRGCVYDCSFCTIGRFWGRRSRVLPVERLVREVLAIRELPAAKSAYLCHDLFGANRAHALEFCDAMERLGAPVPWEVRARVDHVDEELARRMGRAGCYRVLFGIESGDPALRNAHAKKLDEDLDVVARIEACVASGVMPILSIILGLPGEDEQSLAATLDLAARAALAGVQLSFHLVNPQPGCGLGESHAASSAPVEGIPPDMALGAGETAAERALIAEHPDLFSTWFLLVGEPGGEDRLRVLATVAERVPELLMRTPRSFVALAKLEGRSTAELLSEWERSGRSFEALCRRTGHPLVLDVLRWEQAVLRAPARRFPDAPWTVPERVAVEFDPAALAAWLRGTRESPPEREPAILCPVPTGSAVRTSRVSGDVAALLERLEASSSPEALEAELPGSARAVEALVDAGLLA